MPQNPKASNAITNKRKGGKKLTMYSTRAGEESNGEQALFPKHALILGKAGITDEITEGRPYYSLTCETRSRLMRDWKFTASQLEGGGFVIERYHPTGEAAPPQVRHDAPRRGPDGSLCKYDSPKGSGGVIDVHPLIREKVMDPSVPLWIPESVKGEDALASVGLAAVGFQGVWGWSKGKRPSPDWRHIPLEEREVILAFDSDTHSPERRDLRRAVYRLYQYLAHERGAVVSIALVPEPGPEKVGIDDHLAAYRDARDARDAESEAFVYRPAKAMGE